MFERKKTLAAEAHRQPDRRRHGRCDGDVTFTGGLRIDGHGARQRHRRPTASPARWS